MSKRLLLLIAILTIISSGCSVVTVERPVDSNSSIPAAKNLDVPFSAQAPDADWREPWKNACEETSIIMIDSYFTKNSLSKDDASKKILALFKIKEENFGESKDESMKRMSQIIDKADLSWTTAISINPELNAIKKELAEGNPVIAPIDARILKNSPYVGGELDYHVLVISGYDDKRGEFIVQDPGTKTGKNDRYKYDNFYEAINDYLPDSSPSGSKAVLFTKKK